MLVMKNELKKKMNKRPLFGMTFMSGSPAYIESLARFGYDFAFIDSEHSPHEVTGLKDIILAARFAGISPVVRVTKPDPVEIRKAYEMGAEAVVIPHCKTREMLETGMEAAKYPPLGRRGYDSAVRAAGYGAGDYDAGEFIDYSNETEMVIPLAEDFEFIDNIDDILEVEGLEIVNFGPADFALSHNIREFYKMEVPEVGKALDTIIEKCHAKGIKVMAPGLPPTLENVQNLIKRGVDMLIVGTDLMHFQNAAREIKENVIDKVLK